MGKLKKRKGFTLTEVIISLVILSMIIIGILGYFSSGYTNILRQREQNIENFDVQKFFEEKMAEAKLKEGTGTEVLTFNYQVGSRTRPSIAVRGETLKYNKAKKSIRLFVSNQKEVVLETPTDFEVTINNPRPYYYLGETIPEGKVELNINRVNNLKIESNSNWMLSYRSVGLGDVVPIGSIPYGTSGDIIFPRMLEDFKELKADNYPAEGFKVTAGMRGKYLTFAGRAVNSYGRVGEYKTANDKLWIMGIPIVNDLVVHTDVDLTLTENNSKIAVTDSPTANGFDTDMKNYRNYLGNLPDWGTSSNLPIWRTRDEKIGQPRQFLALQGDTSWFGNRDLTKGTTTSLLIGNKPQSGQLLAYSLDSLKWGVNLTEQGTITVSVTDPTNLNTERNVATGITDLNYSKDHSIQVRTNRVSGKNELEMELFLDGRSIYKENIIYKGQVGSKTVEHPTSGKNAKIIYGGNTYINELAMYVRALTNNEIETLSDYFAGKYDKEYNAAQP